MGACFSTPEERAAIARLEEEQRRLEHWRATGFVSLRDAAARPTGATTPAQLVAAANVNAAANGAANGAAANGGTADGDDDDDGPIRRLPPQVVDLGPVARVLDVADNALEDLAGIERLTELQRMLLSGNRLSALPPGAFGSLLWLLAARNRIASLDPADDLGARLPRLERLVLAHNRLEALPGSCVRGLRRLRVLALAHNRLVALPEELGELEALEEVDAQHNQLTALPASLAKCARLRAVLASHNRIAASGLPPALFAEGAAPLLQTVALKFNPLRREDLASVPGCLEFDARARAAAVTGGVGGGGGGGGGGGLFGGARRSSSNGDSGHGNGGGDGSSHGGGGSSHGGGGSSGSHAPLAGAAAGASSGRGVLLGGTGAEDAAAVALRKTDSREIAPVALLLASGASKRRMAAGEPVLNGGGLALEALEEDDEAGLAESGVRPGILASQLRKGSGRFTGGGAAAAAAVAGEGAALRGGNRSSFSAASDDAASDTTIPGVVAAMPRPGSGGVLGAAARGQGPPPPPLRQDSADMSDVGSVMSLRANSASTGGNVLAVARRTRSFADGSSSVGGPLPTGRGSVG